MLQNGPMYLYFDRERDTMTMRISDAGQIAFDAVGPGCCLPGGQP